MGVRAHLPLTAVIGARERSGTIAAVSLQLVRRYLSDIPIHVRDADLLAGHGLSDT